MRRTDRQLERSESLQIIDSADHGVLSTVSPDGQPYGVPLNHVRVGGELIFHSAMEGHKLQNIAFNDRASFCVVGDTEVLPDQFTTNYESVIVFGRVRSIEGEDKLEALRALIKRYGPPGSNKGEKYIDSLHQKTTVLALTMDHISGKARR